MTPRSATRHLLGLAAITSLLAGTSPRGQEPATPTIALNTATVTLAGNSNIHAYTASTTVVRLTQVQLASGLDGGDPVAALLRPGAIQAFELAIPAATLSSPKDGLNKNMHKALKIEQHADITFRLVRFEAADAAAGLKAVGVLRIAGVEREITLALEVERKDSTLSVKGAVDLLMTDYGIKPPTAMLGMLKTDPKVKVTFETVLTIPLT